MFESLQVELYRTQSLYQRQAERFRILLEAP